MASPVYAHLRGLIPVNGDAIETPQAKYFNALQSDWLDLVRSAQQRGCPADILTLAMNAPTRLHERQILFEAAKALIALRRYSAAERVLRDVIRLDPDYADAQIRLAQVPCYVDRSDLAEQLIPSWQRRRV
jgi:hypothetical protein